MRKPVVLIEIKSLALYSLKYVVIMIQLGYMKAVVINTYGSPEVLQIKDIPKPTINDNEILVNIKAVAVTAADSRIRGARFPKGFGLISRLVFGVTKPRIKILGNTYSGIVAEVGKNVTEFKVGDEVCGMTGGKMGTYVEYMKVAKFHSIAKKPASISHEDAAGMLFGGTAALYFLKEKIKIKAGETTVINGASGAVGTNAVQLAKYFGATVTGVTSGNNAELVKSLGADDVIDYTKQSLSGSGRTFDIILDTVGNISPEIAKPLLTSKGRAGLMVGGLDVILKSRGPIITGVATEKAEDIQFLLSLMEQDKLKVVIDSTYDLKDIVKGHAKADGGQKVGNVIVRI